MAQLASRTRRRHHVRITVSVFAEHHGRLLFIREQRRRQVSVSEPVGHVEAGEGILPAAAREFQEETGFRVHITGLVGVYQNLYSRPTISDSLRFAFAGTIRHGNRAGRSKNIRTFWVPRDEAAHLVQRLSHPTSRRALKDFLRGQRFPLRLLQEMRLERKAPTR